MSRNYSLYEEFAFLLNRLLFILKFLEFLKGPWFSEAFLEKSKKKTIKPEGKAQDTEERGNSFVYRIKSFRFEF